MTLSPALWEPFTVGRISLPHHLALADTLYSGGSRGYTDYPVLAQS